MNAGVIKKLFKSTFIYTIGDFLVVAVSGILLLPYYTRVMTLDEYGVYGVLNALIVLLTFVVQFGIISTFARHYFLHDSVENKKIYIGQLLLIHIAMTITLVLILFFIQPFLMQDVLKSINNKSYYYYYYCAVGVSVFSFLNAMYSVYLRITERPNSFVTFQLSSVFLYVLFIFIFRLLSFNGLEAVILALLASSFFMWCISLFGLPYSLSFINIVKTVKSTFVFATPILIAYIMYFCLNKFNILLLQGTVAKQQLAMFTFALQLSTIITVIAGSAGKAIQPALYKLNEIDVINVSKKLARYYKWVMFAVLIVFILFTKPIILLFAPSEFLESKSVLQVLLISAFIYNLRSVEASLFFYFHKPKWSLYITSISAFVVIVFSLFFIHKYGIEASAYSMLAGSVAAYVCNMIFYKKLITTQKGKTNRY